jgi:hypothetical protein
MTNLEKADGVLDSLLLQIENDSENTDSDTTEDNLQPIIHQLRYTSNNKPLIELNFLLQLSGFILYRCSTTDLELVTKKLEELQLKIDSRLTLLGDFMED